MQRCAGICGRFPVNRIPDKDMQRRLSETVMDCYNAGFKHIVTGMSGQFEQMAVRIVSELKTKMPDMTLTVVMTPCECSGYARYLSGKGSDRDLWEYVETADNLKPVAGFAADGLHAKEPVHRGSFVPADLLLPSRIDPGSGNLPPDKSGRKKTRTANCQPV